MTCDTRPETLVDLLEGELSEEEAVLVEQHLTECKTCRAEINALALFTHPFVSEEPWQPDAAMCDRVLRRAQTGGWAAAPPRPSGPPVPSVATTGARSRSSLRSFLQELPAWCTRPLPSYAAAGLAAVALLAGLVLGGGAVLLGGRGVPSVVGSVDPPGVTSLPADRPAGQASARPDGRQAETDSSWQSGVPARRGQPSAGTRKAAGSHAFVAVYTDAMRLTTPGVRDSF